MQNIIESYPVPIYINELKDLLKDLPILWNVHIIPIVWTVNFFLILIRLKPNRRGGLS